VLDAVVAGDVAYNQIHQMLALGGPAEWAKWIASIEIIERLHPQKPRMTSGEDSQRYPLLYPGFRRGSKVVRDG